MAIRMIHENHSHNSKKHVKRSRASIGRKNYCKCIGRSRAGGGGGGGAILAFLKHASIGVRHKLCSNNTEDVN